MKRRKLLWLGGGLVVVGGVGFGALAHQIRSAPHPHFATLDAVERWLDSIERDDAEITASGAWTPAQVFGHCAQSLEFSVSGFPQLKPAWFRATVGPAAFAVFHGLGGMKHDLAEPVPGTTLAALDAPLPDALARLRSAIATLRDPATTLQPHFAYGALERAEVEAAHAMHISEHASEIERV